MIIFDKSKNETHHPNSNFKKLCRRLRLFTKVKVNKEELSHEELKDCSIVIIGSPKLPFKEEEFRVLAAFIENGGSVAIFSSEGGDYASKSNLNVFLSEYGMSIDRSSVIRAVYHKYLHPKHALITNGIIQPEIGEEKDIPLVLSGKDSSATQYTTRPQDEACDSTSSLSFVYPNGTTISVQSPSFTLLSSGTTSYPVDCPLAAAWESDNIMGRSHNDKKRPGRLIVVGSSDIFADDWLDKEENGKLCDVFFRFLLGENIEFDSSQGRSDFEEKECVPDISSLANLVKSCIQENEPRTRDYNSMLCTKMFEIHNDCIPDVIDLYKRLNVEYEPLTLVRPHFECPHPPLRMSTHPPRMMDPPPPALELFDLDECFSDVRVRLSQLTNQFIDDSDLEDYVQEAGWIIGLHSKDRLQMGAKDVLYRACARIFEHKCGLV
mmetsp:Transcript_23305/g.49412  ORF Transcript_23305/g.49412 Transcript_23305/m.49412 type:complete len:436 (+) Transcript_23305:580-1887(+)